MSSAVSPVDETRRRAFERQWIEHGTAQIRDHLPPESDAAYEATLLELVCIDMEMRSHLGDPPSVSTYVDTYGLDEGKRERLLDEAAYLARRSITRGSRIGKYVLREILGQGAFATVWRAHDPDLSRVVALKRLRPALATDDEARERFRREARSAARLRHPAIVTVHQVGEDVSGPYLVSDYIPGPTLTEALKKRAYTADEAAELITRLADALDYAHQFGIVHRDVKPSNVLLDEGGRPLLTDFGLASLGEADATLTRYGQLLGTPAYMSPEQARGDNAAIDRRSDVYSLGVVLYELLCGRPPFQGEAATLFYAVLHRDVPRPRKLDREIPSDLETICLKAIAREPGRRYATADAFADDLRRFLAREPIEARRSGVFGRVALWARRNPAIAASLALVVLVGAIAFQRVLEERTRFEDAHQRSQANLYRSLVRQAEAQLSLPRGAGREAAWRSIEEATRVETRTRDDFELRSLALRYLIAGGPHFRRVASWTMPEEVAALALSPDGVLVVEVGPAGTRVRDAESGVVLKSDLEPAQAVAFARDGRTIALARGKRLSLTDTATLNERTSFVCREAPRAIAFDPRDAHRLACGSPDGPVEVVRMRRDTSQRLHQLPHPVHGLAFGRGNRLVLGCVDGGIRQVDLNTGAVLWTERLDEPVRAVAAAGERVAAFSWERLRFDVFDARDGGRRRPEGLHEASLRAVAFGPDGHVLSVSSDGFVAAYDKGLARVAEIRIAGFLRRATVAGRRILALDREGRRWVVEMRRPQGRATFPAEHRACFLPGTRLLFDGQHLVDVADGTRSAARSPKAGSAVWGVAVSRDGSHVARTTHDGRIELLDGRTLSLRRRLLEEGPLAWCTAFSPDGRVLAAGSGSDVLLFDVASGRLLHRLEGHERLVSSLAFRGEELLSGSLDRSVRRWAWRRGEAAGLLSNDVGAHDLFVDRDLVVAACRDGRLRIWEQDGAKPRVILVSADPLWAAGPGPDGLVAIGSQSGLIRLFDRATWQPVADLRAGPRVRSVACDATGRYLAASVYVADGVVWDLRHLREELHSLGLDWD